MILRSSIRCAALCLAGLSIGTGSLACSSEPLMASVCIMAVPWTNLQNFMPAVGTQIAINSNQALYSLLGTTFGGDGRTYFLLPDLRGRVIVGAGQPAGGMNYVVGAAGGSASVTLQAANVPLVPHAHTLSAAAKTTVAIGTLAATTTLNGVTATAAASGLSLKGYSGNASTGTASGGSLATPQGPANKIYAGSAPDVNMAAGSISGTAPVTFSGNPATTLAGLPTVAISGSTDPAGQGATAPVSTMPPYLPMNIFIAVQGLYPSRN